MANLQRIADDHSDTLTNNGRRANLSELSAPPLERLTTDYTGSGG